MRAIRTLVTVALPAATAVLVVRPGLGASDRLTIFSRLQPQAERLWREMPDDPRAKSVRLVGGTVPECARAALIAAKAVLSERQAGPLALRTLALETEVPPAFREAYRVGMGSEAEPVYEAYLQSDDADEFLGALRGRASARLRPERLAAAEQETRVLFDSLRGAQSGPYVVRSGEEACGTVWGALDFRALPVAANRRQLSFATDGNCRCRAPANAPAPLKLSAWRVLGTVALEPDGRSTEQTALNLKWRAKDPEYVVFAACGCADEDEKDAEAPPAVPLPAVAAAVDPACGSRCQSLQGQVRQRLHDAASAGEKAQRLDQRARRAQEELEAYKQKLEEAAKAKAPRKKPAKPKVETPGLGVPSVFLAAAETPPKPRPAPRPRTKAPPAPDPQLLAREQEAQRSSEAADLARRQADYLQQSADAALQSYEACFRACPPPPRRTEVAQASAKGFPKPLVIGGGAVLVAGTFLVLGGGGDEQPAEGNRPPPAPSPSPSPMPSPSPTAPGGGEQSGIYGVGITVEADPGGHNGFIQLGRVTQVNVTAVAGAAFSATGASPWVAVNGGYDGNRFNATGQGTVAGRPNVGVSFSGTLNASGLNGQYVMGAGRELPGGQPITYRVIGQRSGP